MKPIKLTDKATGKTYEVDISNADISITGDISIKPVEVQPPPVEGEVCKEGPEPKKISNVTATSLALLWHGKEVYGWDWWIQQDDRKVAEGKVTPLGNTVTLTFPVLSPGKYTLFMQGNTCKSDPKGLEFTVPTVTAPPPVEEPGGDKKAKFQIIMGTTGSGFDSEGEHGMDQSWVDRIEATKFKWGYGISGICVWIPWNSYEKKPGQYEEEAFKRIIRFCKARKLTLSVAFLRRRLQGDGFLRDDELIRGSNGSLYYEGVLGTAGVYAGYANDRVNALSSGAIRSIARLLATYDKAFYFALAGGGAGEQVNYVFNGPAFREAGDFSQATLAIFDKWRQQRGIAPAGIPPMVQGAGNDWPHPDFNNPVGLEFARFTTWSLRRAFDAFVDDVKAVSELKCFYFYSVTSNLQFRSIANPCINWIAERADGLYGSDGDGPDDLYAKIKVNSLNLGTFPNKVSSTEIDPDDISPVRKLYGRMPRYGEGNLLYDSFLNLARNAFSRGLEVLHLAMAYDENELRGFEPYMKQLWDEYLSKDYVRPAITDQNTVTVEVTDKYRRSQDLMEGVNAWEQYTRYTSNDFWGGVPPQV